MGWGVISSLASQGPPHGDDDLTLPLHVSNETVAIYMCGIAWYVMSCWWYCVKWDHIYMWSEGDNEHASKIRYPSASKIM